ncbi:MAG: ferrochelatase [Pseudomonas fluorescens]|nr:MAG: ferrochelatase [Pseudomonas fluorescens]
MTETTNLPPQPPEGHPRPRPSDKVGVVLVNLGTPDGTDYWSVRRYLKEFLSDPRVIEVPKVVWWFILNIIILTFRPKKSGHAYEQIWDKAHNASPLRVITEQQVEALQARLGDDVLVSHGMRYGNPSLAHAMHEMVQTGIRKILVAPLYPQYSAATTATVVDKIGDWMKVQRWQPTLRYLPPYYDHPAYIEALRMSIQDKLASMPRKPDLIVASFHGLPLVNCQKGDVYYCHSHKTARLLAESLGAAFLKSPDELDHLVSKGRKDMPPVFMAFQSRFGAQEWLKPYFAVAVEELPKRGVKNILVVCPGFSADCVETLEEIAIGGKESFMEAGGTDYDVVPCLNASDYGMDMLEGLVEMELMGWKE